MTSTETPIRARGTSRKVKAILAGGLVLGIGAAVTLAAWTDQEWATATFSSGHFNLVGSTDGTNFSDHATVGTAAALTFSTGFNNLSPDTTVSALYALRLDAATTVAATGVVSAAVGTGTAEANLTYRIVQVGAADQCTPNAGGIADIVSSSSMDAVTDPQTFALSQGSNGNPGGTVLLCIQVTTGPGLLQDTSATGTWTFTATSLPPV
jgi:predicted ribosomally synthesized peptide with SipW-like signal peptide